MNSVLTDIDGDILIIRLNRPDKRNAVDRTMAVALGEAVAQLEASPNLRVGVLTGVGKAFSAGADLAVLAEGNASDLRTPDGGFAGLVRRQRTKPLIAAVNGDALGGGFEIALACDIQVASVAARFGLVEVTRGVMASAGGVFRLTRVLPPGKAIALLLTGTIVSASQMEEWGLLWDVVAPKHLEEVAIGVARQIAAAAPLAVQSTLRVARGAAGISGSPEEWLLSEVVSDRLAATHDAAEGARSFLEARPPQWTGR